MTIPGWVHWSEWEGAAGAGRSTSEALRVVESHAVNQPVYLRARERRTAAYRWKRRRRQTIGEGAFASLDRLSWARSRVAQVVESGLRRIYGHSGPQRAEVCAQAESRCLPSCPRVTRHGCPSRYKEHPGRCSAGRLGSPRCFSAKLAGQRSQDYFPLVLLSPCGLSQRARPCKSQGQCS